MNNECKHNWKISADNLIVSPCIYADCLICGEHWNAERLVNSMQNKIEKLQEGGSVSDENTK